MTGLGLTGPGGMAGGLMTPSFPGGVSLGGPPAPPSPVGGKTGLPGSATGLVGLSQIQQHVRITFSDNRVARLPVYSCESACVRAVLPFLRVLSLLWHV